MKDLRCPALVGKRILVVDDDADTREMLAIILESSGAVVATAETSMEALAAWQKARPDVLISDLGLPGDDGHALLRQLRALPSAFGADVPAIALTGRDSDADVEHAGRAGFCEHLTKPVSLEAVLAAVVRALEPSGDVTHEPSR